METKKKSNRGGARLGAGRPRTFAGCIVPVGIGLPPEEGARLRAMAEAEGVALGVLVVRLMDYYQQGHPIPETMTPHHKPETPQSGHIPDINPTRL